MKIDDHDEVVGRLHLHEKTDAAYFTTEKVSNATGTLWGRDSMSVSSTNGLVSRGSSCWGTSIPSSSSIKEGKNNSSGVIRPAVGWIQTLENIHCFLNEKKMEAKNKSNDDV